MNEQWNELKATITDMRDNYGTGTQREVCRFLVRLMNRLEKQMSDSEKTNKWIPISKGIPKEKGYYITTTIYNEVYCDYWNGDNFDRTEAVLAWQKLPAPFKPQERDDENCDDIWERAYLEREGKPQPKERTEERTETHACDKKECWIEHNGTFRPHIECPKCGCWFLREDLPRNSYCPNCGSRNHWAFELKLEDGGKRKNG